MEAISLKITDEQKHLNAVQNISSRYSPQQKERIADATKQFEALMTQMMLKSMNQSSGGMFGEESHGGDIFNSVFESEMSQFVSANRSLGIAEALYKKITGEKLSPEVSTKILERVERPPQKIQTEMDEVKSRHPLNVAVARLGKFDNQIENASQRFGISENLIKSVILAESSAKENALSRANAKGLMQLMDGTAREMGVTNVWDPKQNIMGGTKYLSQLLRQYDGNLKLALAAYNAGPGNVAKFDGIPPFEETRNYITRVLGYLKHFES